MRYKREDITLRNIRAFIEGNIRYKLYYSKYSFIRNLIPKHIKEQIDIRIKIMRKECFDNGYCVECGCKTTALQMAKKSCDGNCYPELVSRKVWKFIKSDDYKNFRYNRKLGRFIKNRQKTK